MLVGDNTSGRKGDRESQGGARMARNPRAKIIALVVAIALVAVAAGTYALTRSVARQSALTTTARLRADHAAASGSRSGSR